MRQSAWKGGSITNILLLSNLNGFTDLHTHGIGRYDTRTAAPEDILRIAELHGKAGTAAFLPTVYAGSINKMRENMEAVRKAMESQKTEESQESRVKSQGLEKSKIQNPKSKTNPPLRAHHSSLILGVHLEGPFLNPARCGALDKSYFLKPSLSYLSRLTDDYKDIIKIITIAPEMPGALKVIEKSRALGIKVNMGHSDATYKEAESGKKAGASGITHIFNAMRPFHHREPGIAGFGLLDKDTYIEVIADGVHLHKETLRLIFSIKRHDRIILISDSVKGAGKGGKPAYKAKGILSGSGLTVSDSLKVLKGIGIPQDIILKTVTDNPGTYLHSS